MSLLFNRMTQCYNSIIQAYKMDNLLPSIKSHKHKFSKTNLTVVKKFKKYWDNLVLMEGTLDTDLDTNKQEVISDESEISAVLSSSSQELTSSSVLFSVS